MQKQLWTEQLTWRLTVFAESWKEIEHSEKITEARANALLAQIEKGTQLIIAWLGNVKRSQAKIRPIKDGDYIPKEKRDIQTEISKTNRIKKIFRLWSKENPEDIAKYRHQAEDKMNEKWKWVKEWKGSPETLDTLIFSMVYNIAEKEVNFEQWAFKKNI